MTTKPLHLPNQPCSVALTTKSGPPYILNLNQYPRGDSKGSINRFNGVKAISRGSTVLLVLLRIIDHVHPGSSFYRLRVPQGLNQAHHRAHALSKDPGRGRMRDNESKHSTYRKISYRRFTSCLYTYPFFLTDFLNILVQESLRSPCPPSDAQVTPIYTPWNAKP